MGGPGGPGIPRAPCLAKEVVGWVRALATRRHGSFCDQIEDEMQSSEIRNQSPACSSQGTRGMSGQLRRRPPRNKLWKTPSAHVWPCPTGCSGLHVASADPVVRVWVRKLAAKSGTLPLLSPTCRSAQAVDSIGLV